MGERVLLRPVEAVRLTTVVDNMVDLLLPDQPGVRRWGLAGSAGPIPHVASDVAHGPSVDALRAEHGYSALIDVDDGDRTRRVLYDAGGTPDGLMGNLDRLGVDPATFEAIVLSHGHFDHVTGLHGLARRLGRRLPILLHPDCWNRRRIVGPDRVFDLPTPSRTALTAAGFDVVESARPSFLLDEMLLVTGTVRRATDYETGMPGHQARKDGRWVPDPMINDDQAAVVQVRGRGLVVLTGCAHAGVINIVRHAQRLTGVAAVHAVIGGLHLRGGEVTTRAAADLAAISPDVVAPAHCTAWQAHRALQERLPEAYVPSAVGSRFEFSSAESSGPSKRLRG